MTSKWRTRACAPEDGDPRIQTVVDDQERMVAAIGWSHFTPEESDARGRLIAAAPAMREALADMLRQFGNHPGSSAIAKARAALAAAERDR